MTSGDVFNPCIESISTRGAHFVPILNSLNITAACYGNHDFGMSAAATGSDTRLDFGTETLNEHSENSNFPWVMSNVRVGSEPVSRAVRHTVVEVKGVKIGIMGL